MKRFLVFLNAILLILGTTAAANAALLPLPGGMIYDDVNDVTWLQDANYSMTSNSDPYGSIDGKMDYTSAQAWASNLNFAGFNDWILPTQEQLQNLYNLYGIKSSNPSPFINVQNGWYWTSTPHSTPGMHRLVHMEEGGVQSAYDAYIDGYVLVLREGYSACWPIPNAEFSLHSLNIIKIKPWDYTYTSMYGTVDLPELDLDNGDKVECRITIELFGVLEDGGDLVISDEATLSVKDYRRFLMIRK